jgi:anthraniloyl-CoA monooxygenase
VTPSQGGTDDGAPTDAQQRAVAGLAHGGAGLVLVEGVAVSPDARTTAADLGLYRDAHVGTWKELVTDAQRAAGTLVGVQLRHAGARGATRTPAEGTDRPLREGAWPLVAAWPLPYTAASQPPQELDEAGMEAVREAFAAAARAADHAGFDLLEIDFAHGYLLAGFVSPLTNQREDGYGGELERRLRFPLSVLAAVRGAWPPGKPLSVRCTASDLQRGGITEDEAVAAARGYADAGADLLHVVAGQTTVRSRPEYGSAFNAPWADLIRNRAGVRTITSGAIPTPAEANHVLAVGQADLCVLGRPLLRTAEWLTEPTPDEETR